MTCQGGGGVNDPERYKTSTQGQHVHRNDDIEDIFRKWEQHVPQSEMARYRKIVRFLVTQAPTDADEMKKAYQQVRRQFRCSPKRSELLHVLHAMLPAGAFAGEALAAAETVASLLTKKSSKSESDEAGGAPKVVKQKFSCEWNCYYCPSEPDQPRSYLHDEPAVLRANQNRFDPVLQFMDRAVSLAEMGHPIDKVELLVLGGTWASYPHLYQEQFIRDLFYAANTFHEHRAHHAHAAHVAAMDANEGEEEEEAAVQEQEEKGREEGGGGRPPPPPPPPPAPRARWSLREEQEANESARVKVIGLTLETRPDTLLDDAKGRDELRRLRRYGCTRVQLGVQHTDDAILKRINRGHTRAHAAEAIRQLKDACFKVDVHLMPNLPGSTAETDEAMFDDVLDSADLQADQWKIYPCEIVPWTIIKKWHDSGKFTPYPEEELVEMLMRVKAKVHPWIRLNRVVRDIPSQYILGGINETNLRQRLQRTMESRGQRCRCIRCREVLIGNHGNGKKKRRKQKKNKQEAQAGKQQQQQQQQQQEEEQEEQEKQEKQEEQQCAVLVRRRYASTGGTELFLSFETEDERTIFGFLRLRLRHSRVQSSRHSIDERKREDTETGVQASQAEQEEHRNGQQVDEKGHGDEGAGEGQEGEVFPELRGAALIRELHVYGQLVPSVVGAAAAAAVAAEEGAGALKHADADADGDARRHTQHVGFGTRLVREAERLSVEAGFSRIAVISGVGTRNYYRKLGFEISIAAREVGTDSDDGAGEADRYGGDFMLKSLAPPSPSSSPSPSAPTSREGKLVPPAAVLSDEKTQEAEARHGEPIAWVQLHLGVLMLVLAFGALAVAAVLGAADGK